MARMTLTFLIMAVVLHFTCMATIQKGSEPLSSDDNFAVRKRPFCNAFTGCGRKRSPSAFELPLQEMLKQREFAESMEALLRIEPALDELQQMVVDAKFWEIINEMSRRKSLYK